MNEISKIKELIAQVLRDNNFTVFAYQINEHDIDIIVKGQKDYIITVNTVENYENISK